MAYRRGDARAGRVLARPEGTLSRIETDALTLALLEADDGPRIRELMEKRRDLPIDLADAAPVRVAERESLARIFTLDFTGTSRSTARSRRRFAILPA